jgi:mono/diheme cytochrome c family protein
MKRAVLNLTIDSVAAALLTAMVGTGYILWFVLPPGTNRTHVLWGLLRHQWGAAHFWLSVALLAMLAVHVALHWRWLLTGLSHRLGMGMLAERSPRLAGSVLVAAAAAPLAALAVAAHLSVHAMDRPLHPLEEGRRAGEAGALAARAAAVLAERCASCHGERAPAAGVRADTPEALRRAPGGMRWVVPGRPDESRLLEVVAASSAPREVPPRHRLDSGDLEVLRAWIGSLRN